MKTNLATLFNQQNASGIASYQKAKKIKKNKKTITCIIIGLTTVAILMITMAIIGVLNSSLWWFFTIGFIISGGIASMFLPDEPKEYKLLNQKASDFVINEVIPNLVIHLRKKFEIPNDMETSLKNSAKERICWLKSNGGLSNNWITTIDNIIVLDGDIEYLFTDWTIIDDGFRIGILRKQFGYDREEVTI